MPVSVAPDVLPIEEPAAAAEVPLPAEPDEPDVLALSVPLADPALGEPPHALAAAATTVHVKALVRRMFRPSISFWLMRIELGMSKRRAQNKFLGRSPNDALATL
jgi:hypothetical protein